jgi:hypothetical protein
MLGEALLVTKIYRIEIGKNVDTALNGRRFDVHPQLRVPARLQLAAEKVPQQPSLPENRTFGLRLGVSRPAMFP